MSVYCFKNNLENIILTQPQALIATFFFSGPVQYKSFGLLSAFVGLTCSALVYVSHADSVGEGGSAGEGETTQALSELLTTFNITLSRVIRFFFLQISFFFAAE